MGFVWIKYYKEARVDSDIIQVYKFCCVPFGVILSPFLLGAKTLELIMIVFRSTGSVVFHWV